jgi:hypothetical protein
MAGRVGRSQGPDEAWANSNTGIGQHYGVFGGVGATGMAEPPGFVQRTSRPCLLAGQALLAPGSPHDKPPAATVMTSSFSPTKCVLP